MVLDSRLWLCRRWALKVGSKEETGVHGRLRAVGKATFLHPNVQ